MSSIHEVKRDNKLLHFPSHKANAHGSSTGTQKQARQKLKHKRLVVVALMSVISLYALIGLTSLAQQWWQMKGVTAEVTQLNDEIKKMKVKNEQLREEVTKLNSKSYVERVAREKLGLVKPGEKVLLPAQEGQVIPLEDTGEALYE